MSTSLTNNRSLGFSSVLSLVFTLVFILAIEHWIGWGKLLRPWQHLDMTALLLACTLVLGSYGLRAVRLYDYFRPHSFFACLRLILLHNLFNNFLPMRTGEISFPLLMQRYFRTPLSQSTAALLWFRLLDLHSLGTLALVALVQSWLSLPSTGALLCLWLSLPWLGYRLQHLGLRWLHPRLSVRYQLFLEKIQAGLPQQASAFWRAWLWTLLNWSVKLLVFAWVLSLFIELAWQPALLGAVGGELSSVSPIHGIAGAGTYEAGIIAALLPFGVALEQAIQAAVNLHLFLLGMCLLGGALAVLFKPGNSQLT